MKFQAFNNKAKLLGEREIELSEALTILNEYLARSNQVFENGDIAMEQTCFCLSRNNKDYLQVNCDGSDELWFYSDRLFYDMNLLFRILCSKTVMAFGGNSQIGKQIITDYFEMSRESFERKYQNSYRNYQQFGYIKIT